jgi:hypothetical protein
MKWQLVNPIHDVDRLINKFRDQYGSEAGVLTFDENFIRKNLTVASTIQLFDKSKEFIAYAENNGKILGVCWFDRGGYSTYSTKEISNSKFHHIDLTLPVRQRIKILNDMIDQHLLWADNWGIPVVCSSSIRKDHQAFMRIHEKRGFTVCGSFAWIDTKEGVKWIR